MVSVTTICICVAVIYVLFTLYQVERLITALARVQLQVAYSTHSSSQQTEVRCHHYNGVGNTPCFKRDNGKIYKLTCCDLAEVPNHDDQ